MTDMWKKFHRAARKLLLVARDCVKTGRGDVELFGTDATAAAESQARYDFRFVIILSIFLTMDRLRYIGLEF